MVEQVSAWKSSDGQLHQSAQKAAEHELRARLTKLIGNSGFVNEIMSKRFDVYDALTDYVSAAPRAVEADNASA